MSDDRLQQSLRQLHATADSLQAGAAAPRAVAVVAAPAPARPQAPPTPRQSMKRVALFTLAHTVAWSTVLIAGFALVDPLLPRPDGPELREPQPTLEDAGGLLGATPPNTADRP